MTKTKPFLIAMSGGSGSGKSTLAEALLAHLPEGLAVMFGEDAYYLPMKHYGEPSSDEERTALIAQINYDAPESKEVDQLVKDLRTGVESTSPDSVLDGELNAFMEASLVHQISGKDSAVEDID